MKTPKAVLLVSCFLLVAVLAVFGRTVRHGFVSLDDGQYVYSNPHVTGGLSGEDVVWAFSHFYAANWHPLTWLSHMLDWEVYQQAAWGHHLSSVLLHAAAAILLFLALRQMTAALWPSALVAAVFAIHPLRVESVAWIAERKDVLSGVFFMLTLLAYADYARRPGVLRYLWVVLAYVLGLMAKPMLVTVPLVLLLLDYWPLGRLRAWRRCLAEKLPLLALAAASCVATILAQRAVIAAAADTFPFSWRLGNAIYSYVAYTVQFFYPVGLTPEYPYPPGGLPVWRIIAAAIALAGVTILALLAARKHPYLIVGWLWYLGMLVPVIGLVQVGSQPMADRYTYLPQIGLSIMLAWPLARLASFRPVGRVVVSAASACAIAVLMVCAWWQTGFWRDNETLWRHTLDWTSRNPLAENDLGVALAEQGKLDDAMNHFRASLTFAPEYRLAQVNAAKVQALQGRSDLAVPALLKVVEKVPDCGDAQSALALALMLQHRFDEALVHFRAAVELDANSARVGTDIATHLFSLGCLDEAIVILREGVRLQPASAAAHYGLAQALLQKGEADEAIQQYQRVVDLDPANARVRGLLVDLRRQRGAACRELGTALMRQQKIDEAVACYYKAVKIDPSVPQGHSNLAALLYLQGRCREAIAQWLEAIRLQPDDTTLLRAIAWVLATSPKADARNGAKALELAQRAAQGTARREATILDTLAAAYAETGQYAEAVATARAARDLAIQQANRALADAISARVKLYERKTPFRDESLAPPARKR